ncbi:unnamed protein product [Adineta ricciae]|uniref:G-protein coupled receptors family 1 profile domain-containing protein n=1 Tax=Adineta ricciae TaxID=249248 RepID=A0A815G6A2_ADIRI|nr:unnamed protein product [Adineta ricciae]CAF1413231.1 unnamed protein product [Adineta ricciae]
MSNLLDEINYLYFVSGIIAGYGSLIIFVLGIIGNSINILVFSCFSQFNKGASPVFLLFSFVTSQTYLLFLLLPQIISQLSGVDSLVTYLPLCKIRWFVPTGGATISLHCLSLAAFNQYLLVSRNVRHHQWINQRRAVLMSSIVVIYTAGLMSPNLVYYKHIVTAPNKTQCTVIDPIGKTYDVYNGFVIYSLLPIIALSTFSFLTWWNIRKGMVRRAKLERSLARLIFAQIIMVLLASIGFFIRRIYFLYYISTGKSPLQLAQETLFNMIFLLIGHIIHSFSFYTYFITSEVFRQNLLSFFGKRATRVEPTGTRMKTMSRMK